MVESRSVRSLCLLVLDVIVLIIVRVKSACIVCLLKLDMLSLLFSHAYFLMLLSHTVRIR